MKPQDPKDGDSISEALATAAATVASAVLVSKARPQRVLSDGVDEITIERSLLAVIKETEWRTKAEMAALVPTDPSIAFEGLDDVDVAVYLDPPTLVSDAMDDRAPATVEASRRPDKEAAIESSAAEHPEREEIAARLEEKIAQVEEGSYFDLLEVSSKASAQELRDARDRLRAEFSAARLESAKLANLRDRAEMLLSVLDEAYTVLCDPSLLAAYRAASGEREE
jgi:hypothetical protein